MFITIGGQLSHTLKSAKIWNMLRIFGMGDWLIVMNIWSNIVYVEHGMDDLLPKMDVCTNKGIHMQILRFYFFAFSCNICTIQSIVLLHSTNINHTTMTQWQTTTDNDHWSKWWYMFGPIVVSFSLSFPNCFYTDYFLLHYF